MRPLRLFEPGRLYFISQRTVQGRLLLRPSPKTTDTVGGILARATQRHRVRLHAVTVLSNHMHLIVSTDDGDIAAFMGWVSSNIARKVGHAVGWREKFWGRRFSAEPILDEGALYDRLRYIFAHGVKEGLVDRAADWPGLTSIPELVHGVRRVFHWDDWTARHAARGRGEEKPEAEFVTPIVLELSRPVPLAHLSDVEHRDLMGRLLEEAERRATDERQGKAALGVEVVLGQEPHERPIHSKRSRRPLCHVVSRAAWDEFRQRYSDFVATYREAAALFRAGVVTAGFPPGSYPPAPMRLRPA